MAATQRITSVPRGMVLVERNFGHQELWFTNEVKPREVGKTPIEFVMRAPMPEHDPEVPEATQPPASPANLIAVWAVWDNVERWRFANV